jgi:4-hydroxybenzoate polyprenyltransferase
MTTIRNYLSLVKFSHTIFALPFALIGFFLALTKGQRQWNINISIGWGKSIENFSWWGTKLLLVLTCMVTARSAAMAFNRYLDRSFDAKNPERYSEIPKGIISPGSALRFVILNCTVFITVTFLLIKFVFFSHRLRCL